MKPLTTLELALLRLIHKRAGEASWYQLETGLSRLDVPRTPDAMTVLNELGARNLVVRSVTPGAAFDRWELTEQGRMALAAADAEPMVRTMP